ncbi:MFS transporter [bacterium]|nr:MFS transporter [bacterium]
MDAGLDPCGDSAVATGASNLRVQLGLALILAVFAALLHSVGIVIERSVAEWGVSKTVGGMLDGSKDVAIVLSSLLLASQVPRMGYRRTMLGGLAVVACATALLATARAFWAVPVLFILTGACFALVKVSVYSTVGLIARDPTQHTAIMNRMGGVYQIGAMVAPLVFAWMISYSSWTHTYWVVCGLAVVSFLLWLGIPLNEAGVANTGKGPDLSDVIGLLRRPFVLSFLACALVDGMLEQSIGTWLPTFNRDAFGLSAPMVSTLLSVYFGSLAISRFLFGSLCRRFSAFVLQEVYLACAFGLTATVMLLTGPEHALRITDWSQIRPIVPVFCTVGFFIGPIYPTLSSMVLSRLPKPLHSAMAGLIIIFVALGGTFGSQLVGFLSQRYSTHAAFHFPLLAIATLAVLLFLFRALCAREDAGAAS